MYNRQIIKIVQNELSKQLGLPLATDGVMGKETRTALLHVEQIPADWSDKRQVIGYIQYLCATEGINGGPIDGYWGPQTEQGFSELEVRFNKAEWTPWRSDEGEGIGDLIGGFVGQLFGKDDTVDNDWPAQTQSELIKYYGHVGQNQTKVNCPYPLKIAWNKTQKVRKVTCHEKVADSVGRILVRVKDHYGDRISELGLDLFGGCLNVRKMRGGSKWSTHAWGISFDWDPERNQLRWEDDKANFAAGEYEHWWKLWEEEGWVSLGRQRNYDWMHVQAAKVRKR